MWIRALRRLAPGLLAGGALFQGCAITVEDVQTTVAGSLEQFLQDLFAIAVTQWIDALFNLS